MRAELYDVYRSALAHDLEMLDFLKASIAEAISIISRS